MNEEILEKIINGKKHILVSGQKESGKTSNVLFPIVDKLIEQKESLLVLDYKKEFVATTYNKLKEKNYNIIVLDFDLADETDGWDPLSLTKYFYKKDPMSVKAKRTYELLCANLHIPFRSKETVNALLGGKLEEVNLEVLKNIALNGCKNPDNMYLIGALSEIFADEKTSNMLRKTTFNYDDILNKPTAIFIVNNVFTPRAERLMNAFINQLLCLFNYETLNNKMNIVAENCDVFNRYYDYSNVVYNSLVDNLRLIYSVRSIDSFVARNGKEILNEFNLVNIKKYTIESYVDGVNMEYPYNFKQVNVNASNFKYKKLENIPKFPIPEKFIEKKAEAPKVCVAMPKDVQAPKTEIEKKDNLRDLSNEELDKMLAQLNKELMELEKKNKAENNEEVKPNEKKVDNITREEHKPIEMPVPEAPKAPEPPAVPTGHAPLEPKDSEAPKAEEVKTPELPKEETKVEAPVPFVPSPIEMPVPEAPKAPEQPAVDEGEKNETSEEKVVEAPAVEQTPEKDTAVEAKETPEEKPAETPAVPEVPNAPEATIKPPNINVISDNTSELEEASKILEKKLENTNAETNEPTIIMEKIDISKLNG